MVHQVRQLKDNVKTICRYADGSQAIRQLHHVPELFVFMVIKPPSQALFMNDITHKRRKEMQFDRCFHNVKFDMMVAYFALIILPTGNFYELYNFGINRPEIMFTLGLYICLSSISRCFRPNLAPNINISRCAHIRIGIH